jgi:hypothetical protein
MGLIKKDYVGPFGIQHTNCYIYVHSYTVNAAVQNARVKMLFYPSTKEKDSGYRPILEETYTFTGELYETIFTQSILSSTVLSGIYSNITSEDLTDNLIFQGTESVYEVMIVEHDGGEDGVSFALGDEISRMEAGELGLIEGLDFEGVAEIA